MQYYFHKTLETDFDQVEARILRELKTEAFDVLTEIDITANLKEKLGVDFRKYKVIGVSNPNYLYQALTAENKIGTMFPCNIMMEELENGSVEVAVINPVAIMKVAENEELDEVVMEIAKKLFRVIEKV